MTRKESKVMRSFQIKFITQLAQGKFQSITLKNDLFVKWAVGYMAENRIPFQTVPMGSGVTRLIHKGVVCPHCEGRGFYDESVQARPDLEGQLNFYEKSDTGGCGLDCGCSNGCSQGGVCCSVQLKSA